MQTFKIMMWTSLLEPGVKRPLQKLQFFITALFFNGIVQKFVVCPLAIQLRKKVLFAEKWTLLGPANAKNLTFCYTISQKVIGCCPDWDAYV